MLKWHGKSKPVTNDPYGGIPEYDIVYVLPKIIMNEFEFRTLIQTQVDDVR